MSRRVMAVLVLVVVAGACLFAVSQVVLAAGVTFQQGLKATREVWQQADGLRAQGKWADATKGYEKSLEIMAKTPYTNTTLDKSPLSTGAKNMIEFCKAMPIDVKKLKDGTFQGKAMGFAGEVQVELTLKGGKIDQFKLVQQKESSPRRALQEVPKRIMSAQSPNVDASSGATVTSYAVMSASLNALQQARKTDEAAK